MTDDDQLMVRIQSGDSAGFEELVEKYESPLIGFFYRNTGDIQLAEDLTQDTLLRVYNQSWDYLPVGRFRGWMYRIARNLLIDHLRRESHDALVHAKGKMHEEDGSLLAGIAGEMLSPEQKADQQELSMIVEEMLQDLPEDQRLTFLLHHYAGLPLSEVADIMETSLPTCKSRLRLVREKLQSRLGKIGVTGSEETS